MSKWKCEICNSEFDNFQAQGFNHQIYCPLCYFKELYKREKNKNDKAIEYIKKDTRWFDYEYAKTYGELCTCKGAKSNRLEVMVNPSNLLEILGDKE